MIREGTYDDFKKAHSVADTDQAKDSIHHTIGKGPFQAASGKEVDELSKLVSSLASRIEALENAP